MDMKFICEGVLAHRLVAWLFNGLWLQPLIWYEYYGGTCDETRTHIKDKGKQLSDKLVTEFLIFGACISLQQAKWKRKNKNRRRAHISWLRLDNGSYFCVTFTSVFIRLLVSVCMWIKAKSNTFILIKVRTKKKAYRKSKTVTTWAKGEKVAKFYVLFAVVLFVLIKTITIALKQSWPAHTKNLLLFHWTICWMTIAFFSAVKNVNGTAPAVTMTYQSQWSFCLLESNYANR